MYFEMYQQLKQLDKMFPGCLESLTEPEAETLLWEMKGEVKNGLVIDDSAYIECFGT